MICVIEIEGVDVDVDKDEEFETLPLVEELEEELNRDGFCDRSSASLSDANSRSVFALEVVFEATGRARGISFAESRADVEVVVDAELGLEAFVRAWARRA